MVVFGAPYYCLELYETYTGRVPANLVLALAGGAAVAPSSLDPWIFLLFWANWNQPTKLNNSRRLVKMIAQQQQQQQQPLNYLQARPVLRSNTTGTSSSSDKRQYCPVVSIGQARLPPYTIRWITANKRQDPL